MRIKGWRTEIGVRLPLLCKNYNVYTILNGFFFLTVFSGVNNRVKNKNEWRIDGIEKMTTEK